MVATSSTRPGSTPDGITHQTGFTPAASVYDKSHHGDCRGYGNIVKPAEPDRDGTRRWYVAWDKVGSRTTAIKEAYLDLALIANSNRTLPAAVGQRIIVVLGSSKGSTGVIEKKSGSTWTCKLDGNGGRREGLPTDYLHAIEPPPADAATLDAFTPKVLASLAAGEVPGYLHSLQFDPEAPIDLHRKRPENEMWFDVLTASAEIASMADDDLRSLHYKAAGAPVKLKSSTGEPLLPEERQALVAGLQRAAAGCWTIKFVCARAGSCGCPYAIEFKHNGSGSVTVTQTEAHQFHDPSSAEDLAQLAMHPTLRELGMVILKLGVKPMQACGELNALALRQGLLGTGGSMMQRASNARGSIRLEQVAALAKQLRRQCGYGLTSDAAAIGALVEEYQSQGCVPFYQPYRAGTDDKGEQPLILILQTKFQRRMLAQFGRSLTFLDSMYGNNKYGYPVYALVVQDDVGRGVPVGFMICSSDPAEVVEHLLRVLLDGARQEEGGRDFTYGWIMIDKSKTEMAAIRLLELSGDAKGWLLCYFHFLQDWERFLISKESEVGKEEKNSIMVALAQLAHCGNEKLFETKIKEFYAAYRHRRKVVARMKQDWVRCADKWAHWGAGRQDPGVAAMQCDTNNLVERCFGLIKYGDLSRKAQSTIQQLVDVLLTGTVPRYMQQRALQLVGRASSDQVQQTLRIQRVVDELVSSGAVVAEAQGSSLGRVAVNGDSSSAMVVLGDMSCTCSYSAEHICVHVKAAARVVPFTHRMRLDTAAHLVESGYIAVGEGGICTSSTLADLSRKQTFRPEEGFCTCLDRMLHGTCCHLLAAPRLEAFQGVDLPAGEPRPEGEDDKHIDISATRTFQVATSEPLGEEWQAEVCCLRGAKESASRAIQKAQTNADPGVAQLCSDAAFVQRTYAALPEGEAREVLLQQSADVRSEAERMLAAAGLQPTEGRAGKQARRRGGRNLEDKVVKPLHPGRRSRHGPAQQAAAENRCDELPKRPKPGKAVNKVRGPTVPGNLDGTVIRNGAAHHRMAKRQRR